MNKSASCRCCLSRPPDKREGIRELYGAMLEACFNIQIRVGAISGDAGICNMCVKQLEDALSFKTQVLQCQSEFEAVLTMALKGTKRPAERPKIKVEIEEVTDDAHTHTEFKSESVDMSDEDDKTLLDIKQETDSCRNMVLTARPLMPAPARIKPAPARFMLVPARIKPVPASIKPVVVKAGSKRKRPQRSQRADKIPVATNLSESERLQIDAGLLFNHSNATPFQHKSIKGLDCLFCRETLPTMAALREHTHNKHENCKVPFANNTNKLYLKMDILDLQCKLCHEDLDLISTLKKHLTEKHNILFKSLNDYILEFKLTDAETMNCARCDSTFETFKTLQQHMSTHYKNCICEVCAVAFINTRLMYKHMKTHETGSGKKCSKCDKVFDNAVKLKAHEKTHRPKLEIKCPRCDETFNTYTKRNRHLLEVHKVAAATYKCNVCDREFLIKYQLTEHIKRYHLMERNHICPVCSNAFSTLSAMKRHMIAHGGDKVHQCAVCQKAYARKYTLSEHMRIHNNDRRFQCGECGVKFVQKCSLKGHMMSSHGLTLADCDNENNVYTEKFQ